MKESINKWMLAALTTWTLLVIVVVAVVVFAGDRIWFNLASHEDVSALMQDKAEYIDAYSFREAGKE